MPEAHEPTSTEEWKKSTRKGHELPVPSGNIALVQRKGMPAMMRAGVIPNELLPLVQKAIEDPKAAKNLKPESPEQAMSVVKLVDSVAVECTLQPELHHIPTCLTCMGMKTVDGANDQKVICPKCLGSGEEERDPDLLYVDEVDFDDKLAIFSYVVGVVQEEAGSFREEPSPDVDGVPDEPGVQLPAERVAGDRVG